MTGGDRDRGLDPSFGVGTPRMVRVGNDTAVIHEDLQRVAGELRLIGIELESIRTGPLADLVELTKQGQNLAWQSFKFQCRPSLLQRAWRRVMEGVRSCL